MIPQVQITRKIRIPTTMLDPDRAGSEAASSSESLTNSPGADDELPQGPDGFYAIAGGEFLITDPLRRRVVEFDAQGRYRRSLNIGFAADRFAIGSDGSIEVREASTGHMIPLSGGDYPHFKSESQGIPAEAASLTGPNGGTITWHDLRRPRSRQE
jgi:hypothetical protein